MFGLSGRQLFTLFIVLVLLFAAAQYIPAYFNAFQFNDYIRQEVKFAVSSRKTADKLRGEILQKANELGIPITKSDIKITRRGPSFTLDLEYHWPINMRVYKHELVFHISESGEIFENASD
jgi:transcriptional regulator